MDQDGARQDNCPTLMFLTQIFFQSLINLFWQNYVNFPTSVAFLLAQRNQSVSLRGGNLNPKIMESSDAWNRLVPLDQPTKTMSSLTRRLETMALGFWEAGKALFYHLSFARTVEILPCRQREGFCKLFTGSGRKWDTSEYVKIPCKNRWIILLFWHLFFLNPIISFWRKYTPSISRSKVRINWLTTYPQSYKILRSNQ